MNKVSFKKSMDKMVINELDYGGFGVFLIWKGILNLKKGNIFEKSSEFFFI